jgi:hypothetical protein
VESGLAAGKRSFIFDRLSDDGFKFGKNVFSASVPVFVQD